MKRRGEEGIGGKKRVDMGTETKSIDADICIELDSIWKANLGWKPTFHCLTFERQGEGSGRGRKRGVGRKGSDGKK